MNVNYAYICYFYWFIIMNNTLKYLTMMQLKNILAVLSFCLFTYQLNAKEYNIIDFGAKSDIGALSTEAIQKAIDECNAQGGGTVIVPSGNFKTGTIILKSHVNLFLEQGATLFGSKNLIDYRDIKPGFVSLRTQEATKQLFFAENSENISISGFGEINGQGKGIKKMSWKDEGITRPHLIRFINCKNVVIENITLKNSACWM